jgi:hypothetical protein
MLTSGTPIKDRILHTLVGKGAPDKLEASFGGETFANSGKFEADDFSWTTSYTDSKDEVDENDFSLKLVLGSSLF